MSALPVPRFASEAAYGATLGDEGFWAPYAREALERAGFPSGPLVALPPGTNPVYAAGEAVVKLFTPFCGGRAQRGVEAACLAATGGLGRVSTPRVLAAAELFPGDPDWPWPYVVMSRFKLTPLTAVRSEMSDAALLQAAGELGETLRALHSTSLPEEVPPPLTRAGFFDFLARQRANCAERQRSQGWLPGRVVAQIDAFLPAVEDLLLGDFGLLHGDLESDHVMMRREGEEWRVAGILDFGDARFGSPFYDLPAVHIGALRCDARLLGAFLDGYSGQVFRTRDFVRLAACFTLLSEWDIIEAACELLPALGSVPDLDAFGQELWSRGPP